MLEIAIITGISIHALREERDQYFYKEICWNRNISIHALREERDLAPPYGGTRTTDFNPRAPRGARQQKNTKQKSVLCDKHRIL